MTLTNAAPCVNSDPIARAAASLARLRRGGSLKAGRPDAAVALARLARPFEYPEPHVGLARRERLEGGLHGAPRSVRQPRERAAPALTRDPAVVRQQPRAPQARRRRGLVPARQRAEA